MTIKHVTLGFWFKELDFNPISRVGRLEDKLKSYFPGPYQITDLDNSLNIGIPRIRYISADKKEVLNMSLINLIVDVNVNDDYDSVILYINERLQTIYDAIIEIFTDDIVYSSVKIQLIEENSDASQVICNSFLNDKYDNLEDIMIKRGLKIDNKYYLNYIISSNKEVNFDIAIPKGIKPTDQDMYERSTLMSLKDSKSGSNYISVLVELNDRLSYNLDSFHRTSKEELRGLIYEIKKILNHEINDMFKKK